MKERQRARRSEREPARERKRDGYTAGASGKLIESKSSRANLPGTLANHSNVPLRPFDPAGRGERLRLPRTRRAAKFFRDPPSVVRRTLARKRFNDRVSTRPDSDFFRRRDVRRVARDDEHLGGTAGGGDNANGRVGPRAEGRKISAAETARESARIARGTAVGNIEIDYGSVTNSGSRSASVLSLSLSVSLSRISVQRRRWRAVNPETCAELTRCSFLIVRAAVINAIWVGALLRAHLSRAAFINRFRLRYRGNTLPSVAEYREPSTAVSRSRCRERELISR